jgi:RNA polymerase sigma factor (sigma-70 family)
VQKDEIQDSVQRALNGDESAYKILLTRYERGIYNMIFQMVKNREETEDLVQETFIKAFNALDSYNQQFAFSTWLYKIAFNNCIDSIRKRKLRTLPLDKPIDTKEGQVQQDIRDDTSSPEKQMLYAEKTRQIHEAIDHLPDKYRRVIMLRHQEERSYEEISEMMKIPIGTVKARIFRAREMLKRCLNQSE